MIKCFHQKFVAFKLLALLSLSISGSSIAVEANELLTNARDMFYEELKGADGSSGTSIAYCLELRRANEPPVLCNNRYAFRSGDGIRLHVKSSSPVYAYIVLSAGSTGKKAVMYPPPGSSENNLLEAGREYLVPPKGMVVFDSQPGTEKLSLIFSPKPLDSNAMFDTRALPIDSDTLTGLPQKLGPYSVCSTDGVYSPGKKAPGSGLVYVHNPDSTQATAVSVVLNHHNAPAEPAVEPTPPKVSDQQDINRPITDKWAVIVGIDNFANFPDNSLRYCASDANTLRDFLINEAGFKKNHVLCLTNEQATTRQIKHLMTELLPNAIRPDDLVLTYFSTHGTPSMKGENYIVTYDFDGKGDTGIPMSQLGDMIKSKIPSNRVVTILDTCFSGNARDLNDQKEILDNLMQGCGQIIVSACSANETSLEDSKLGHGYFTYYLIDSLRKQKALKPSFDLTKTQVITHTDAEHQHPQHPVIKYDRWQGNDMVLFAKPSNPRN